MPTLDRVMPYLESLLEDDDVKDKLRRAGARFGKAKSRAGRRRSRRAAAKDPRVWRRLREGAGFSLAALTALNGAPDRRSSSHKLRWALLLLVVAAAAFVAYDERARAGVVEAAGKLRDAAASDGAEPRQEGTA